MQTRILYADLVDFEIVVMSDCADLEYVVDHANKRVYMNEWTREYFQAVLLQCKDA